MPRPGPRPYECVRRAWHSDRHKPLRGSIIQQIFRLVGDAHGEKTKNNREWQEKLPVVVLKCEEILYSKANTEAEYLDQGTLWERVSDAVNTIIRLEEVNETGKLLPPCVEAALTMGCVPVKASRSQRHCNTRTYLMPRTRDPNVIPHRADDIAATQQCPKPLPASSSFMTQDRNMVRNMGISITNELNPFTLSHERFHSGGAPQSVHLESNNLLTDGSVYPLYYGTDYQLEDHLVDINYRKCNCGYSQGIIIGRPITRLIPKPAIVGASTNLVTKEMPKIADRTTVPACDLSLRLGVLPSLDVDKEKIFAPEANNWPLDLRLSRWNSEGIGSIAESSIRHHTASFHDFMEDGHFSYQPESRADQFSSPKKWPSL